jgi:hypothetical protein
MIPLKLYVAFPIIGAALAAITYLLKISVVINYSDTYWVTSPSSMSIFILLYFVSHFIIYYLLKSNARPQLLMLNLILVSIPIIYILYENVRSREPSGLTSSMISYKWTEYVPIFFIFMFVTGNLFLLANILNGIWKVANQNGSSVT